KAICRRVLTLSAGRLKFDGPTADGIAIYEKDSRLDVDPWAAEMIGEDVDQWPIVIRSMELLDAEGSPRTVYDYGERMRVRIRYELRRPVSYPNFYFGIRRSDDVACSGFSAARDGVAIPVLDQDGVIELLTPPTRLVSDLYTSYAVVWDREFKN